MTSISVNCTDLPISSRTRSKTVGRLTNHSESTDTLFRYTLSPETNDTIIEIDKHEEVETSSAEEILNNTVSVVESSPKSYNYSLEMTDPPQHAQDFSHSCDTPTPLTYDNPYNHSLNQYDHHSLPPQQLYSSQQSHNSQVHARPVVSSAPAPTNTQSRDDSLFERFMTSFVNMAQSMGQTAHTSDRHSDTDRYQEEQ